MYAFCFCNDLNQIQYATCYKNSEKAQLNADKNQTGRKAWPTPKGWCLLPPGSKRTMGRRGPCN